jgi:hypothetical protein
MKKKAPGGTPPKQAGSSKTTPPRPCFLFQASKRGLTLNPALTLNLTLTLTLTITTNPEPEPRNPNPYPIYLPCPYT